jgi:hypothetical protein
MATPTASGTEELGSNPTNKYVYGFFKHTYVAMWWRKAMQCLSDLLLREKCIGSEPRRKKN